MHKLLIFAASMLASFGVSANDSEQPANIFLITHSEVLINASADDIWPYILDTSEWKTLATSSIVSGNPGEFGEIREIRGGSGESAYEFYTETIELIENERKVIAIYFDEAAATDISYAAWTLFSLGDNTMVTYDVNSVNRVPGIATEGIAAAREAYTTPNQIRFNEELLLLKSLVEE